MRDAYVLDASVLAALYVEDDRTEESEAALARIGDDADLHAPDLVVLEVANVLWKRVRRGELRADDAMRAIGDLTASAIRLHPIAIVAPQALSLALVHGFTAYDASYVAVATRVGGIVVTNDGGMRQRGIEAGLPVIAPRELR